MCAGCCQMKDKKELLRIVRSSNSSEKNIFLDLNRKAQGRGIYVCKNLECLKKLKKSKRIERTFKVPYDEKLYEQLEKEILDNE